MDNWKNTNEINYKILQTYYTKDQFGYNLFVLWRVSQVKRWWYVLSEKWLNTSWCVSKFEIPSFYNTMNRGSEKYFC